MKEYFLGDTYETPETGRLYPSDRFLFWTRWNLFLRFFRIVFEAKALAEKKLYDDEAWAVSSYDVFRDIEGCGGRFFIKGIDNIRKPEGPVVVVSNHMSTLETLVFPVLIVPIKPASFVVKEKLVKGPVFGPIMSSLDPITVTRKDPRKDLTDVLTQGAEKLARGRSIVIFPQSTRSVIFDSGKFNSLGIKLAARAGVPIIPAAIKTDFWTNGKILHGFGPLDRKQSIRIEFGEPMAITGRGRNEHQRIVEFISDRMKTWNVPVSEASPSEA
jgi:1-acyl-sn-glycerol-3-phosphate acyltransferase